MTATGKRGRMKLCSYCWLRTMLTRTLLLAPLFLVFLAEPASVAEAKKPGRYELVKGKGVAVCEVYQENLNAFGRPMVCERQIDPKLEDLKEPEWTKPSIDQVRSLEFHMAKLVSQVLNQPAPKSEADIKIRTEDDLGWPAKRWVTQVDIDNDSRLENVLKQEDGRCPHTRAFSVHIAVLTEDGDRYDLKKSQYFDADRSALFGQLTKDPNPWSRRTAGLSKTDFQGYSLYDVFIFGDTTYFDLWEMGSGFPDPGSARLHVFLHQDGKTRQVCTYRLEP